MVPVGNYKDIKLRMNEGDRQRTIAATKMNETSRYRVYTRNIELIWKLSTVL